MESKPIYQSKIFWFGALWFVIAVANAFGYADYKPTDGLLTFAGASVEIGKVLAPLFLVWLRTRTSQPVHL